MNTLLRSLIVFGTVIVFSGGAVAAKTTDHTGAKMQNAQMQTGMAHDMSSKDMARTTMQHSVKYDDKAFLSAMIPHHEAAVVMANDVLRKGKNAQVKKWAHEVIAAQQAEIKQMSGWLKEMGGEDINAAKAMNDAMHTMMTSPIDKDADRNFVVMMIDHHASALEMGIKALLHSENEKIVALSNQIIAAQAKEIMEYKQWLKKNM